MNATSLHEVATNEVVRKRLAKLMAERCFRNTKLEDLHAGTYPSSETGDFADVKVVSPFAEIPWRSLARLSDDEMKVLMIDVVNRSYDFLSKVFSTAEGDAVIASVRERDPVPKWNDPEGA
jgi:hypothetical protein